MNKTFKTQMSAALVALSFAAVAAPAAAQDTLPARAVNALSVAIANQGNAALAQIRDELKDTLIEHVKPYLPKPEAAARADTPRAPAAGERR